MRRPWPCCHRQQAPTLCPSNLSLPPTPPPSWNQYQATRASILAHEGSLAEFAKGYQRYGIVREQVGGALLAAGRAAP
jgi:hypothetical protein